MPHTLYNRLKDKIECMQCLYEGSMQEKFGDPLAGKAETAANVKRMHRLL